MLPGSTEEFDNYINCGQGKITWHVCVSVREPHVTERLNNPAGKGQWSNYSDMTVHVAAR